MLQVRSRCGIQCIHTETLKIQGQAMQCKNYLYHYDGWEYLKYSKETNSTQVRLPTSNSCRGDSELFRKGTLTMSFKKFALVPYKTYQQLTAKDGETEVPKYLNMWTMFLQNNKIGHCNF